MEALKVCLPVLAVTAVPVLAGWLVRRRLQSQGQLLSLTVLLALCAGIGVWGYLGAGADVPTSQAVDAGLTAGIGLGLLPIGFFFAIGYGLRPAIATAIAWFVCSLPIAFYGFVVLFVLAGEQNCPPGAYECPV